MDWKFIILIVIFSLPIFSLIFFLVYQYFDFGYMRCVYISKDKRARIVRAKKKSHNLVSYKGESFYYTPKDLIRIKKTFGCVIFEGRPKALTVDFESFQVTTNDNISAEAQKTLMENKLLIDLLKDDKTENLIIMLLVGLNIAVTFYCAWQLGQIKSDVSSMKENVSMIYNGIYK